MYLLVFSKQAQKDKKLLKSAGLERKTKELLNIIEKDPFCHSPHYEKLVGNLDVFYSRRINIHHRLVYETISSEKTKVNGTSYEGIVRINRMWTHYEK